MFTKLIAEYSSDQTLAYLATVVYYSLLIFTSPNYCSIGLVYKDNDNTLEVSIVHTSVQTS